MKARHLFWLLVGGSFLVYLLTMDRSVSWWDCGEFIATGYLLQVGHPPGAPVYQLLSHLFMLLSFGNPMWVAPLSNLFSVVCGAFTVGLLFLTLQALGADRRGAVVGALCYLFCDTAWFSAVESEVYSLVMLFCALDVWLALRFRSRHDPRMLPLLGLLTGLGTGVHLMTLLALPAVLLAVGNGMWQMRGGDRRLTARHIAGPLFVTLFFFLLGLTPYAVIPIRAEVNTPINELGDSFGSYLRRDQYEKAPLYPRMWRERDTANWDNWSTDRKDLASNVVYYFNYQLGYMYGRYLMNNFIGRENLKYKVIIPFVIPFLLGLWGLLRHRRRSKFGFWMVMLLFLFGGLFLNVYLNHPCYEPRERDYAYVLSFYAFALWIGLGVSSLPQRRWLQWVVWLAPLVMAVGSWSDHDRSHCHSVHDIALNHLESCDADAILLTLGDNDTFPLWYLQQVEQRRTDISVYNLGLTGWRKVLKILEENNFRRPVYISHYAYQRYAHLFPGRLRCEGFCWRLMPYEGADLTPVRHEAVQWHITDREYLDLVSLSFLAIWQQNMGERFW